MKLSITMHGSATFSTGFVAGEIWGLALDLDASPPELTWYRGGVLVKSTDDYAGFELTSGLTYTFLSDPL